MADQDAASNAPAPTAVSGTSASHTSASRTALRATWQLLAPAVWVLLVMAALLAASAGAALWLLRTEAGSAWLLARVPGVQITGLRGALLSDHVEAKRVHIHFGLRLKSLTIDDFVADGLTWHWRPNRDAWVGLQAKHMSASRAVATLGPALDDKPPASLHVPLWVQAPDVRLGALVIGDLPAMAQASASVTVGAQEGAALHLHSASFDWENAHITGLAELGTHSPFSLKIDAQATALQSGAPWQAQAKTSGNLLRFDVLAKLQGSEGLAGQRGTLTGELAATISPFAPWALGAISAQTQGLNLASFSALLPSTHIAGHVDVQSQSKTAPVSANIHLENRLAGRWDEQKLPIRRAELLARGSLQDRSQFSIQSFDILLGASAATGPGVQDGGRWRGSGQWRGHTLTLDTQLQDWRPQLLDSRAARMVVSGPVQWVFTGLPALPFDDSAAAPASGTNAFALALRGQLDGRTEQLPQPVQLTFDTSWSNQRIELRQLRANAGAASIRLEGAAEHSAAQGWLITSEGRLNNFDPLPWWPGAEDSAWRQGPHRLNADWQVQLQWPKAAASKGWLHAAQTLVGSGELRVNDSVLAGVPLQATWRLAQTPSRTATPSSLQGDLVVGGNHLLLDVQADPLGAGAADQLRADLKVTNLAALAPIARLVPELAEWAPREGLMNATLQGQGRWPHMRSSGNAQMQKLRVGELSLAKAKADWRFDTASDQPLDLQLDVTQFALGAQTLEQGHLDLQGTLAKHQLNAHLTLPIKPPSWAESVLGLRAPGGTRAQLAAQGAWDDDSSGGGRWRGRVTELSAGPSVAPSAGASTATSPSAAQSGAADKPAPWFETRDINAELRFSAQGKLLQARADPGRMRLADGVVLQWEGLQLDNSGERPNYQLRAEVSPFAASPIVARLQPGAGWGGDLRLAANIHIQAAEKFDADLVFERRGGDLTLDDSTGRQAMGLSALRLAMSAHDGQWVFSQQFMGSSLGELSGEQRLRTAPAQRWPSANTPLQGTLQARVANLGIWSTWVPPGWRLSGALETQATLGGNFAAPQYTGQVRGSNMGVRNLLLGLDLSGGDMAIALKGSTAQIEQFTLRGGDGQLTVSGNAELGDSPQVKLQLQAQRFRVLGRVDRQLVTSGQATLTLQTDTLALDGSVRVDEGLFDISSSGAPTLDDDVTVRKGQPAAQREEPEPPRSTRRDTRLAVQLDLGDKLRVRGRGLDTALSGQLKLTTPAGKLAISGLVQAQGGTYAAYGQKLDIERGILAFSGAPDNPGLDILALRPNIDTQVGVAIGGNFVTPRIRLFSNPEMSETDKLSWLVLGRASDGLGRADTALLQRAAVALLAGEGEAPTDAFLRSIGIDELSLRQSEGDVRDTVITLGKQLSRRWYLGYERGVNATSGTFQLIYRIAQRFTLRAQSGHDNSLDMIWVWRVGETPLLPGIKTP